MRCLLDRVILISAENAFCLPSSPTSSSLRLSLSILVNQFISLLKIPAFGTESICDWPEKITSIHTIFMEVVSLKMASGTFGEERLTKKAKYDQFEETELRLGLPGDQAEVKISTTVDLKLNLSPSLVDVDMDITPHATAAATASNEMAAASKSKPPPPAAAAKAPVVGWPPVRSFRKNTLSVAQKIKEESASAAAYVKVSMDGAPYLRKVDLNMYKTYQDLCDALAKMFCSFTIGNYGADGMKDFMNDNKLVDLLNGSEYVPTYEDKDGDWMLVGDVPWEMFIESCKRMRIMKGKEAVGLAPRAMEKCKNRN